jgi:hypothetical protein
VVGNPVGFVFLVRVYVANLEPGMHVSTAQQPLHREITGRRVGTNPFERVLARARRMVRVTAISNPLCAHLATGSIELRMFISSQWTLDGVFAGPAVVIWAALRRRARAPTIDAHDTRKSTLAERAVFLANIRAGLVQDRPLFVRQIRRPCAGLGIGGDRAAPHNNNAGIRNVLRDRDGLRFLATAKQSYFQETAGAQPTAYLLSHRSGGFGICGCQPEGTPPIGAVHLTR